MLNFSFRKIVSFAFVFLFFFFVTQNVTVHAISNAKPIQLNKTYHGTLNNYNDKDNYQITLPSAGNVTLSLKNKADMYWTAKIINSKGQIYKEFNSNSQSLVSDYSTKQVGLPKGTYYIQISGSYSSLGNQYEIKAEYTKSNYYEKEFNNNIETANTIHLNKTYKGTISDYKDKDVFKITLPQDGNVTLYIKNKANMSWSGQIINKQGQVYEQFYTNSDSLKSGYSNKQIGLPKGTYYIVITNTYSTYDHEYVVKAGFKASNYYEKEFNDSISTANKMLLNKTYNGIINKYNDKDVLKITIPSKRKVTFSIKHKANMSWSGHIQNASGKIYTDIKTDANSLVSGNTEATVTLYKGTYYVVMKNWFSTIGHPYQVKVYSKTPSVKASQVKVFNNKGKNDTVTVLNIAKGDTVKIYNARTKGKVLASKKATGSSVKFSFKQLGKKAGKIYVTVTKPGMTQSNRVAVSYKGEKSDNLKTSQVKVVNNKGKNDTVSVSNIAKGDTIKVYSASKKGKVLASKKSTGKTVRLSIKQLGKKSGKVYVSITRSGMKESNLIAISYKAER